MSTPPTPPLQITAQCLGPVNKLDASLSKNAQNLIYARNGTGKSFLTRALRFLDLHAQGKDTANAAFDLVSEESATTQGSFSIRQGPTVLGSLDLQLNNQRVTPNTYDRIFHVFSTEFVHEELLQRNYDLDGRIESEIQLDQTNISTKEIEQRIDQKQKDLSDGRSQLQKLLDKQKSDDLVGKALVNKQLREYSSITPDSVLSLTAQPSLPEHGFKAILADLDALKSLPAEPDYPNSIDLLSISSDRLNGVDELLTKVTSPSSISEEIKQLVAANPDFFESGLKILKHKGDETCPFCRQDIAHPPAKDRIDLYLAYFADAEGKHKSALRTAWAEFKNLRTNLNAKVAVIAKEAVKFETLRKLIPSQKSVIVPDFSAIAIELEESFDAYQSAIQAKGNSPAATVAIPAVNLENQLVKLNQLLSSLNDIFGGISTAIKQADAERKGLQRRACSAFRLEFAHANWATILSVHQLDKELKDAQSELDKLKRSQLTGNVKERVAATFEILLSAFFAKKYSFDRATFTLKRDNRAMARGANRTLSDGEKTAIAFCYFIACAHKKLKRTSDYPKLFLVFDDPITSMSYDFVFAIAQTLKNLSISDGGIVSINPAEIGKAKRPDLLVFTHSSYFYNICVTNSVVKTGAAFFLHQTGGEHRLSERKKYVAPFELHLTEVVRVHDGRDPDHTTGNAIRCVLEAIGRFCHPNKCDSLSNYIAYLAGEGGFVIKSILINNLSHGTYYDETPSPDELREACSEAIEIVEKYAAGQLEIVRAQIAETGPAAEAVL